MFKRTQTHLTPTARSKNDTLVLFVHGLGGEIQGTWGNMLRLLAADVALADVSYDCYSYPTSLFRWFFGGIRPGVRELADGLGTYLRAHHPNKNRICLVGHSLGGLVIRQYLLDILNSPEIEKISKVLLYAVPNTGADLAQYASSLSWRHKQTIQLKPSSDFLDGLNRDWVARRVDERTNVAYVVGGADQVVSRDSAGWSQTAKIHTVINEDHRSIVKPKTENSTSYLLLRATVITEAEKTQEASTVPANEPTKRANSDPLFDRYSIDSEEYYVQREADNVIERASGSAHLWVSGESGVGKTAALKRLAEISGWRLEHILLSGYGRIAPLALMSAIITELYERYNQPDVIVSAGNDVDIAYHLKKINSLVPTGSTLALLVEEIPIDSVDEYKAFLSHIYFALLKGDMQNCGSVIWMFSSIVDPAPYINQDHRHFRERVQFLRFERWSRAELQRLLTKIKRSRVTRISRVESDALLDGSVGSPRVIKMVIRSRLNEIGSKKNIEQLLRAVRSDLDL